MSESVTGWFRGTGPMILGPGCRQEPPHGPDGHLPDRVVPVLLLWCLGGEVTSMYRGQGPVPNLPVNTGLDARLNMNIEPP